MTIDFRNNRIYHYDENRNLKEHKPFSSTFSHIEILSNRKLLIIEDYYKYENGDKSNLYCLNKNFEVEWFLPYVGKNENGLDNYVGFTTNGNRIFANTFSCFRVEIETRFGKTINVEFTK